jgi:hypothetical protein
MTKCIKAHYCLLCRISNMQLDGIPKTKEVPASIKPDENNPCNSKKIEGGKAKDLQGVELLDMIESLDEPEKQYAVTATVHGKKAGKELGLSRWNEKKIRNNIARKIGENHV